MKHLLLVSIFLISSLSVYADEQAKKIRELGSDILSSIVPLCEGKVEEIKQIEHDLLGHTINIQSYSAKQLVLEKWNKHELFLSEIQQCMTLHSALIKAFGKDTTELDSNCLSLTEKQSRLQKRAEDLVLRISDSTYAGRSYMINLDEKDKNLAEISKCAESYEAKSVSLVFDDTSKLKNRDNSTRENGLKSEQSVDVHSKNKSQPLSSTANQ